MLLGLFFFLVIIIAQIIIDTMIGTGQLKACNQLSSEDYVGSLVSADERPAFFQQTERRKMREKMFLLFSFYCLVIICCIHRSVTNLFLVPKCFYSDL
jgi:hypothetical protein